ncbi:FAD-binding oxidoreductase [Sphingomonas canadensis]|uniref:FAD-binding oxidoreductase n=1 Tax=Sphingomonas canadensis TaxID=1219257 RepID=A0ABW3HAU0_9SPHN|nr:FAD-binding oxidoreductase [Sphingomonas canadensis]MCW3838243.1 FAD-binding oxidoreductase [Sphingomonas canadensis]
MKLPHDVSPAAFDRAVAGFKAAVGPEWVFTAEEDVALYRDAYSPLWGEPEERVASAAVAPANVEEVQAVVRAANQARMPIYPISTGKNLGYGGSAPALSGSCVVDLKRLDRVLDIDEDNASVLVEPGVSYFDLYREIRAAGAKLWIDCPDPGWGSPIGNALDRGGGYTRAQFRNHFDAHCGMEVVLPSGELLRTGMGAMPGAKTWQQYKPGFGPWIDGLFSQSNFGIVTKMGFWMMPEPEACLIGRIYADRYEDLPALVRILTHLENAGIVNGMPGLGSPLLQRRVPADPQGDNPNGAAPVDQALHDAFYAGDSALIADRVRQTGRACWSALVKFYGPEKLVRLQWQIAKRHFAAIPGARAGKPEIYGFPLTDAQLEKVHKPTFGIPSLSVFNFGIRTPNRPEPLVGHQAFSPVIPRTGEAIIEANRLFARVLKEEGLPVPPFSLPGSVWERTAMLIVIFPVTRDPETNRKYRSAMRRLIAESAKRGWGEYRTPVTYYDAVMETYSFGDHALRRFHETVKDAIDPNGILSPGRYGIWPRRNRTGGGA